MRKSYFAVALVLTIPATSLFGACIIVSETTSSGETTMTTSGTAGAAGSTAGAAGSTAGSAGSGGAGGTTGGSAGSGGSSAPANDQCPGEKVGLALGEKKTINGTLKGATDDYTTFCADMDPDKTAPDVVYQLDVPATATVSIKITGTGFIPALSLRKKECAQRVGGDQCLTLGTGNVQTKVSLDAGSYWIVVDSADKNAGDFTLDVDVEPPACGDGVLNPGEQCDPLPAGNDDGCFNPGLANGCQFGEPPPDPAIVQCPGGMVTIAKGDKFLLGPYNNGSGKLSNGNALDDPMMNGTGPCTNVAYGPEDVFQIMPTGDGTLSVTIGHTEDGTTAYCSDPMNTCGDFILYLRDGSCDQGAQLACDDVDEVNNLEVLNVQAPVSANKPYWVFVDSYQDTPMNPMFGPYPGPYYLEVSLQ